MPTLTQFALWIGVALTSWGADAATFGQYPPPADIVGNRYTVPKAHENAYIDHLVLPDGLVMDLDPSIRELNWAVKQLTFGQDVVFDVSVKGKNPKPATPASPGQANACDNGIRGSNGTGGYGPMGNISVNIYDIATLEANGSLWVNSSGGAGGDGGDGSQGGMGGGHGGTFWSHCGANPGGKGGNGGLGGTGGNTAAVSLKKKGAATSLVSDDCAVTAQQSCGMTFANPAAGQKGVIIVRGSPGCGGAGGKRGGGGPGGDSGAGGGPDGDADGQTGAAGRCATAEEVAPLR